VKLALELTKYFVLFDYGGPGQRLRRHVTLQEYQDPAG
jgi:hypothetical protein